MLQSNRTIEAWLSIITFCPPEPPHCLYHVKDSHKHSGLSQLCTHLLGRRLLPMERKGIMSPVHPFLREVPMRSVLHQEPRNYTTDNGFASRFTDAQVTAGRCTDQQGEPHILGKLNVKCNQERSNGNAIRGGQNIPLELYFRSEGEMTAN